MNRVLEYAEILCLKIGDRIRYSEYQLNHVSKKRKVLGLDNLTISGIVPKNTQLSREQLLTVYGEHYSDAEYLKLSKCNDFRVIVKLVDEQDSDLSFFHALTFNKYFVEQGFQAVELLADIKAASIMPKTLAKGFSSYDVGFARSGEI